MYQLFYPTDISKTASRLKDINISFPVLGAARKTTPLLLRRQSISYASLSFLHNPWCPSLTLFQRSEGCDILVSLISLNSLRIHLLTLCWLSTVDHTGPGSIEVNRMSRNIYAWLNPPDYARWVTNASE
jgi:hypothetical protein